MDGTSGEGHGSVCPKNSGSFGVRLHVLDRLRRRLRWRLPAYRVPGAVGVPGGWHGDGVVRLGRFGVGDLSLRDW